MNTNEAVRKWREKKQTVNKNMKRTSFLERAVEECCEKLVAILSTDFCPNSGTHLREQESLIAIAQRKGRILSSKILLENVFLQREAHHIKCDGE